MTDQKVRGIIALSVIGGFFAIVMTVLLGFVYVADPTIAKIVGMLMGYITALLNPIIMRYFKEPMKEPPPGL